MKFKDLKVGDYFKKMYATPVMVVAYHRNDLVGSVLENGAVYFPTGSEEVILMDVTIEAKPKPTLFTDLKVGEKYRIIEDSEVGTLKMRVNNSGCNVYRRYVALEGRISGVVVDADEYTLVSKVERVTDES